MSQDFDDFGPLPPRAPGPRDRPRPGGRSGDREESTFRPNPGGSAPGSGSGPRSGEASAGRRRSSRSDSDSTSTRDTERLAPGAKFFERIFFGRVSSGQLAQFCRQFASYLHAGVDYSRALAGLEKQFALSPLAPAIGRLAVAIKSGSTLEEAMSREPQAFGTMFLSMIRAAEARGGVPETLRMMGHHYEARQRLIRQARSAMIYPVIVLLIAGGVIALITYVLLPMFASLLRDFNKKAQLPWPSRALLAFSDFMQSTGWWLVPVVVVAAPFLLLRFYKTAAGKALIDLVILRLPVFGSLFRKLDTSRFARTLSTLLDAGLDYGTSINLTADVLSMDPMRQAVRDTRPSILNGRELSVALAPSGQFPSDVIAVLQSGEETGRIPESLVHLADDYEEQVSLMVKNMGQLIQPILIMFLGGIVLFIILAVLLPYIQLITAIAH
ncbi:MAG TPA: type II secretion system F family protein [Isosphaeraceae bacterium]|nr:type II secretion system F family protein [Isosphaeraceae bacterium]